MLLMKRTTKKHTIRNSVVYNHALVNRGNLSLWHIKARVHKYKYFTYAIKDNCKCYPV